METMFQKERLQPSLLDRLVDDSPVRSGRRQWVSLVGSAGGSKTDQSEDEAAQASRGSSSSTAFISARKLREFVTRDIAWLMNTVSLSSVYPELEAFPHVAKSVLNYGTNELTGRTVAGLSANEIEERIRQVVLFFEPRIMPASLVLEVSKTGYMDGRALAFDLHCDIWGQPAPEHLVIRSIIDLQDGHVAVAGGRS